MWLRSSQYDYYNGDSPTNHHWPWRRWRKGRMGGCCNRRRMGSHKIPLVGLDGWRDGWMDGKSFTTMTSFTICNPYLYAKPMTKHPNFGKKKTCLVALQTQWDTLWLTWPLGCPKKQLKKNCNRVICKVKKTKHINKVRFQKKNLQKSTLTIIEGGVAMKLRKPSIFVINWVSPCLLFLKRLHCYYIYFHYSYLVL